MMRKIIKLVGDQCDGTVTLAKFELSCGHEVFVRKDVPGFSNTEAFCKYCAPGYPEAVSPIEGWPKAKI